MLNEYYEEGIVISRIFGQTETSTITWLPPEDSIRKIGAVRLPAFHSEVRIDDKNGIDVPLG
jgi:acyl-coenzyme A synthetase/AMP-(fatty) acid ligase